MSVHLRMIEREHELQKSAERIQNQDSLRIDTSPAGGSVDSLAISDVSYSRDGSDSRDVSGRNMYSTVTRNLTASFEEQYRNQVGIIRWSPLSTPSILFPTSLFAHYMLVTWLLAYLILFSTPSITLQHPIPFSTSSASHPLSLCFVLGVSLEQYNLKVFILEGVVKFSQ